MKFVRKIRINNIPSLVRRPGDKPLSEPMTVSLLTHICVTRPQWVEDTSLKGNQIICQIRRFLLEICDRNSVHFARYELHELLSFTRMTLWRSTRPLRTSPTVSRTPSSSGCPVSSYGLAPLSGWATWPRDLSTMACVTSAVYRHSNRWGTWWGDLGPLSI